MPHFTIPFSQGAPLIDLIVSASAPRLAALDEAGVPWPAPQQIRGLIDTGASHSCVDPTVLKALRLQPTGNVPMHTPSTGATPMNADTYDAGTIIPNGVQPALTFTSMQVSACELLLTQGFHALIGRDILASCILVYNGGNSTMTLSY